MPFRGRGAAPVGFMAQIALHRATEDDLARDPGARAIWLDARAHGAGGPGEEVLAGRWFMDGDAYQRPSPSFNVVTMRTLQEWVGRPALAWYALAWHDAEAGAPMMRYIDFRRAAAADFTVGGRRYAVFTRDWRRGGAGRWLEVMAERELGAEAPAPAAASPLALSQPDFAAAVRRALRDLHRPAALAANPLLRTGLLEGGDAGALAAIVREAVRELSRRAARRAAVPRAGPHLSAPGAHPGGGGGAARPALQHLPRASHARRRAGGRAALAAGAVRRLTGRGSAGTRQQLVWRLGSGAGDRARHARRTRHRHRGEHGRPAGRPGARRLLRAGHGGRPRHPAGRLCRAAGGAAGPPRALADAARAGLHRVAAPGLRRRDRRGGRADLPRDGGPAVRAWRPEARPRLARADRHRRRPAADRGSCPATGARAPERAPARRLRRARARRGRRPRGRRADPPARGRQQRRDARGGPRRVRDRARRARAGVARRARVPAARRGAAPGGHRIREPVRAAPPGRARRRQARADRAAGGPAAGAVPVRPGGRSVHPHGRRLRAWAPTSRRPRRLRRVRVHGRPAGRARGAPCGRADRSRRHPRLPRERVAALRPDGALPGRTARVRGCPVRVQSGLRAGHDGRRRRGAGAA